MQSSIRRIALPFAEAPSRRKSQSISQKLFCIIEDYTQIHYEFSPAFCELSIEKWNAKFCTAAEQNLSKILNGVKEEETFRDRMNELMRLRNIFAPELQRNADVDRRLFSKINGKKIIGFPRTRR